MGPEEWLGITTSLGGLPVRQKALFAAVAVALGFLLYTRLSPLGPANRPSSTLGKPGAQGPELPRIDLARLASPAPAGKAGRRDLFEFGLAEPERGEDEDADEPPPPKPRPEPVVTANPELAPPVMPFADRSRRHREAARCSRSEGLDARPC